MRNIVRVWDVYAARSVLAIGILSVAKETAHYFYVVMDLCRGGELFDMINEANETPSHAKSLGDSFNVHLRELYS